MKILAILIIIFLPISVLAHGLEPELRAEAGTVPGEAKYFFEKIGEWIEVNLLTVSTKKKQAKKLEFASERVAELGALFIARDAKQEYLHEALQRYQNYLRSAEDMAEVIIFLDGAEIKVAEKFEEETRLQEKFLRELSEGAERTELTAAINEALTLARNENKKIFTFMVEKYQFDESDIRKHRIILGKHINLVKETLETEADENKLKTASDLLAEAEKFRKAGLNIQTYEYIEKAKNVVY